jgi:hypothetical protein
MSDILSQLAKRDGSNSQISILACEQLFQKSIHFLQAQANLPFCYGSYCIAVCHFTLATGLCRSNQQVD